VLKPRRYLEFGLPRYWVLDPVERVLWIWDRESGPDAPRRETGRFAWSPDPGVSDIVIDIEEISAPI
jgi:hypothetical protein